MCSITLIKTREDDDDDDNDDDADADDDDDDEEEEKEEEEEEEEEEDDDDDNDDDGDDDDDDDDDDGLTFDVLFLCVLKALHCVTKTCSKQQEKQNKTKQNILKVDGMYVVQYEKQHVKRVITNGH